MILLRHLVHSFRTVQLLGYRIFAFMCCFQSEIPGLNMQQLSVGVYFVHSEIRGNFSHAVCVAGITVYCVTHARREMQLYSTLPVVMIATPQITRMVTIHN